MNVKMNFLVVNKNVSLSGECTCPAVHSLQRSIHQQWLVSDQGSITQICMVCIYYAQYNILHTLGDDESSGVFHIFECIPWLGCNPMVIAQHSRLMSSMSIMHVACCNRNFTKMTFDLDPCL